LTGQKDSLGILELSLFGEFTYRIEDSPFQSLKSRKAEAVLLALAISGEDGISRQALVEYLWPDLPNKSALAGLRQALTRIRSFLPGIMILPRLGWVALSRLHVRCDYWDILFAIKTCNQDRLFVPKDTLLTRFPHPTTEFEDWVIRKKNTCTELIRQRLDYLIKNSETSLSLREIACKAQVTLSETEEPIIATVLDFYRNNGDTGKYYETRQNYIKQLKNQLGLQPTVKFMSNYTDLPQAEPGSSQYKASSIEPKSCFTAPVLEISETFRLFGNLEQYHFLSETIPQDIMSRLTRQNWFEIRIVDSSRSSKSTIAELLNSYLLDGTIRFREETISISVYLKNRVDGTVPWSHKFEGRMEDTDEGLIQLVDKMSEIILTKLVDAVADDATRLSVQYPDSVWISSMKARNLFWRTSPSNNREAQRLLDPIIESDSAPVSAMVTGTFTRLLAIWSAWHDDPQALMNDAMRISEKAVRQFPTDPWSHFALATCFCASNQHVNALRTINRSLDLHDSFAAGLGLRGHVRLFCGETVSARDDIERSMTLNPLDPHLGLWLNTLAMLEFLEGNFEGALNWSKKALSVNSYWFQFYVVQTCIYDALGLVDKAEESFRTVKKLTPNLNKNNWTYSHPCGTQTVRNAFESRLIKYGL